MDGLAVGMGLVCVWFPPCYVRAVFYGFSGFPPFSKINNSKYQFDQGIEGDRFISREPVKSPTNGDSCSKYNGNANFK